MARHPAPSVVACGIFAAGVLLRAFHGPPAFAAPSPPTSVLAQRRPCSLSLGAAAAGQLPRPLPKVARHQSKEKSVALMDNRIISAEELAAHKYWIVIRGSVYDVEGYLRKHPGGSRVFERYFNGGDATEAFEVTRHSKNAYRFLERLRVGRVETAAEAAAHEPSHGFLGSSLLGKFFTHEDRFQIHKILGVYVLLHYIYRHIRVFAGHPTAGLDGSWTSFFTVLPHALLSSSSFIFHVPRERVAERPMIWQEFRGHNVTFALRSAICFFLLWLVAHAKANGAGAPVVHFLQGLAICGSAAASMGAMRVADSVTRNLRADSKESTTATMPYWQGCSEQTERHFKAFYTYAQILATAGCMWAGNPCWPFVIMFPIQLASLLMTCVRKGALSTRGYHIIYAGSLVVPFFVGMATAPKLFPPLVIVGTLLYFLRRRLPRGTTGAKYMLWAPVVAGRVALFANAGI